MGKENLLEEVKPAVQAFKYRNAPVVFYIIKTGLKDMYLVIEENAYFDEDFGKMEIITKELIEQKYNIKLTI